MKLKDIIIITLTTLYIIAGFLFTNWLLLSDLLSVDIELLSTNHWLIFIIPALWLTSVVMILTFFFEKEKAQKTTGVKP